VTRTLPRFRTVEALEIAPDTDMVLR